MFIVLAGWLTRFQALNDLLSKHFRGHGGKGGWWVFKIKEFLDVTLHVVSI